MTQLYLNQGLQTVTNGLCQWTMVQCGERLLKMLESLFDTEVWLESGVATATFCIKDQQGAINDCSRTLVQFFPHLRLPSTAAGCRGQTSDHLGGPSHPLPGLYDLYRPYWTSQFWVHLCPSRPSTVSWNQQNQKGSRSEKFEKLVNRFTHSQHSPICRVSDNGAGVNQVRVEQDTSMAAV